MGCISTKPKDIPKNTTALAPVSAAPIDQVPGLNQAIEQKPKATSAQQVHVYLQENHQHEQLNGVSGIQKPASYYNNMHSNKVPHAQQSKEWTVQQQSILNPVDERSKIHESSGFVDLNEAVMDEKAGSFSVGLRNISFQVQIA